MGVAKCCSANVRANSIAELLEGAAVYVIFILYFGGHLGDSKNTST